MGSAAQTFFHAAVWITSVSARGMSGTPSLSPEELDQRVNARRKAVEDADAAFKSHPKFMRGGFGRYRAPRFTNKPVATPAPGQYGRTVTDVDVAADEKGNKKIKYIGTPTQAQTSSWARSRAPRFKAKKPEGPGPGQYGTKPSTLAKDGASAWSKSSSQRFTSRPSTAPGPGAYNYTYSSFL